MKALVLLKLPVCLLLCSCAAEAPAAGTGDAAAAAAASAGSTAGSGSGGSSAGSAELPPVMLPPELEGQLAQAFSECETSYLKSLRSRWLETATVTRIGTPAPQEDREARALEYRLVLNSNFVYFDRHSGTSTQGSYVRETARCRVRYDEISRVLRLTWTTGRESIGRDAGQASPAP